jgi:AraC family transcriptional regulator of adaptative response/methylated-DNA-[protein]-cysteine methyltransferase
MAARARTSRDESDDARWNAVRTRDAGADGSFFYAVKTTGVFCRPSCGARLPRVENVAFYATVSAAKSAGFRPCKRCKPDSLPRAEREGELVATLCRFIEQRVLAGEAAPTLDELGSRARLSAFHTHRLFKAVTGVTPKAYAASRRAERVRRDLGARKSVTQTMYDAGFNSSGRFYEASKKMLGMTPSRYRAGGASEKIRFALGSCSLGALLVAFTERGICAISVGDDARTLTLELKQRFPQAELESADRDFARMLKRVVSLIERPHLNVELPLDVRGTAFQLRVWEVLSKVPAGTRLTYRELAGAVGSPRAVRAVARACAANTLAVAIPCHRVVRSDGSLSGYRWGVERKRELLDRETRR